MRGVVDNGDFHFGPEIPKTERTENRRYRADYPCYLTPLSRESPQISI